MINRRPSNRLARARRGSLAELKNGANSRRFLALRKRGGISSSFLGRWEAKPVHILCSVTENYWCKFSNCLTDFPVLETSREQERMRQLHTPSFMSVANSSVILELLSV